MSSRTIRADSARALEIASNARGTAGPKTCRWDATVCVGDAVRAAGCHGAQAVATALSYPMIASPGVLPSHRGAHARARTLLIVGQCAVAQRVESGRDVAATCASCHGTGGASIGGIESLAGRPKEELLARMREFKSGALGGTVMPQLAKGYTDEQIEVVCAWFAAQRPAR